MDRIAQLGINALPALAIALVVAGIAIAIGAQVTSETGDDMDDYSAEQNATLAATEGLGSIADKLPLIGLVVGAVVVLGLVIGGLAFRRS